MNSSRYYSATSLLVVEVGMHQQPMGGGYPLACRRSQIQLVEVFRCQSPIPARATNQEAEVDHHTNMDQ